ncbi:MAG: hypothetical protein H6735_07995 [Alphaproteobacteria bacterium]|nr:hypothetical protein [Alphaproteobacteria bacterium]
MPRSDPRVFDADEEGAFPISFDVSDIALDGTAVWVTVGASLRAVPEWHQSFAHACCDDLVLDLFAAIRRELDAAGLPALQPHLRELNVSFS